jgi:hypothetical protein
MTISHGQRRILNTRDRFVAFDTRAIRIGLMSAVVWLAISR